MGIHTVFINNPKIPTLASVSNNYNAYRKITLPDDRKDYVLLSYCMSDFSFLSKISLKDNNKCVTFVNNYSEQRKWSIHDTLQLLLPIQVNNTFINLDTIFDKMIDKSVFPTDIRIHFNNTGDIEIKLIINIEDKYHFTFIKNINNYELLGKDIKECIKESVKDVSSFNNFVQSNKDKVKDYFRLKDYLVAEYYTENINPLVTPSYSSPLKSFISNLDADYIMSFIVQRKEIQHKEVLDEINGYMNQYKNVKKNLPPKKIVIRGATIHLDHYCDAKLGNLKMKHGFSSPVIAYLSQNNGFNELLIKLQRLRLGSC